jgi:LPXTG-motif cell wall-anchored protein
MKKLIIAITAIAVIGIGASTGYADESETDLLPIECSERDEQAGGSNGDGARSRIPCVKFYIDTSTSSSTTSTTSSTTSTTSTTTTSTLPREGGEGDRQENLPPPAPTTIAPTTTEAPQQGSLPRTGSGASGPLQIGAILLVIGGIAIVATRRRSTATTS